MTAAAVPGHDARTHALLQVLAGVCGIVACQAYDCRGDEKTALIRLAHRIADEPALAFEEAPAVARRLARILDSHDARERTRLVQRLQAGLLDRLLGPGAHSLDPRFGGWLDDGPRVTVSFT